MQEARHGGALGWKYDLARTAAPIRESNLPDGFARHLETGGGKT